MPEFGYTLSCEEHPGSALVRHARMAEEAGFAFAGISDHYHPWTEAQGHSPFVWSVLGGIAEATERLRVFTGVTCPIQRYHPAIVAQAAATVAEMMPGRFMFGVGTGENLNEHVVGRRWPAPDERLEMLEEAIEIIRELWKGGSTTIRGRFFDVIEARVYTLPQSAPPVLVAAKGDKATELAARVGDGVVSTSPDGELVRKFEQSGGAGKPKYGQLHVCWAESEEAGKKTAFEMWPNTSIPGELGVELPLPRHFEQAAQTLTPDDVAKTVPCGPDPGRHLEAIREYLDAGFDHVYVHQIGPEQEGFLRFYAREVLPELR